MINENDKSLRRKSIRDVGDSLDGKLLVMAIARLSTKFETTRTPDEILADICDVAESVYKPNLFKAKDIIIEQVSDIDATGPEGRILLMALSYIRTMHNDDRSLELILEAMSKLAMGVYEDKPALPE